MRRALVLLACLSVLVSCSEKKAEYKEKLYVFGTLVEVIIRDTDEEKARDAVAAVSREFNRMHKDWHAWKPGEMMRLNQAFAQGEKMNVSPFLLPLIKKAKTYDRMSNGFFNPAIGAMVAAWGFHADELPKGRAPPEKEIRKLAAQKPSMSNVSIDKNAVSSSNPAVKLDFGGFAKGEALDQAEKILREFGIKNAILNAGGDLNVMGSHGDRPWRVGIRHPKHRGVIASAELKPGEVLYTSGNYERFFEHQGIRYAHILDPRTGWPVDHIVSASVIHNQGALADAAATALTVAGPKAWHGIAQSMGIKFAMLVDKDGTIYLNPAMKARIRLEGEKPAKLIVSAPLNQTRKPHP